MEIYIKILKGVKNSEGYRLDFKLHFYFLSPWFFFYVWGCDLVTNNHHRTCKKANHFCQNSIRKTAFTVLRVSFDNYVYIKFICLCVYICIIHVWTCTTMKAREVIYLWGCSYKTHYPLSSRNWCLVFRNDAEPDQISVPTHSIPWPPQDDVISGWSYTRSIWW